MQDFITPPAHINFLAKKLCNNIGNIIDVSIAYLDKNGGGPISKHTHAHNHFFIVTEGEAKLLLDDEEIIIKANESYLVKGDIPHSVWNNTDNKTVMVGISVE